MEIASASDTIMMMSDGLKGDILTAIVSMIVTVTGFIVSYFMLKKNFSNELNKRKNELLIEKMAPLPYQMLEILNDMMKLIGSDQEKINDGLPLWIEKVNELADIIYCYGSKEAVSVATALQEVLNKMQSGITDDNLAFELFALLILLATQIKYDVTNTAISVSFYFRSRVNDYESNKELYDNTTNTLIEKLELNSEFKA